MALISRGPSSWAAGESGSAKLPVSHVRYALSRVTASVAEAENCFPVASATATTALSTADEATAGKTSAKVAIPTAPTMISAVRRVSE